MDAKHSFNILKARQGCCIPTFFFNHKFHSMHTFSSIEHHIGRIERRCYLLHGAQHRTRQRRNTDRTYMCIVNKAIIQATDCTDFIYTYSQLELIYNLFKTTTTQTHNSTSNDIGSGTGRSSPPCEFENCFTFSFAKKIIIIRNSSSSNNNYNKNTP